MLTCICFIVFQSATFTPVDCKKENNIVRDSHYPPYNGFGSEEDSLSNCKSIIPKPPQKNFMKFMEKDKHGLESHVLQFKAKLDSGNADNQNRNFIISYYLSDDTISIFEPLVRNSGWLFFSHKELLFLILANILQYLNLSCRF